MRRRADWRRTAISRACRSARAAACSSGTRFRSMPNTSSASAAAAPAAAAAAAGIDITLDGDKLAVTEPAQLPNQGHGRPARHRRRGDRSAALGRRRRPVLGLQNQLGVHAGGGVQTVAITGPFNATSPGDTPSRRRIFVCRPADGERRRRRVRAEDCHGARPAAPTAGALVDDEVETLMSFYQQGRNEGDFEIGIQQALARILVAPRFLYRDRRGARRRAAGRHLPHQRSRAGVAPVVLPLEQHPGRRAAGRRGARAGSAIRLVLGAAGEADARRSQVGGADDELRRPVAVPARARERADDGPGLQRQPAAGVPARDRDALLAPSSARTGASST